MAINKTLVLKVVGIGCSIAGMVIGTISTDKQNAKTVEETVKKQLMGNE